MQLESGFPILARPLIAASVDRVKLRALVADESEEIRRRCKDDLVAADPSITILEAVDGPSALDVLKRESIDLCLIDRTLPRVDGHLLVQQVQQPNLRTVFVLLSDKLVSPATNTLGLAVIAVPAIGGLIIGLMARYGSEKIRGHGIPEAIEAILFNKSRMSPKVAVLKPLSAAISIGSGGPFGAEGPIIMTGGAVGSMLAQTFHLTVAKAGTGNGSVSSSPAGIACGATCENDFANGSTVTLTAAAAAGSSFTAWSGACNGASATQAAQN